MTVVSPTIAAVYLAAFSGLLVVFSKLVRRYILIPRFTILNDLPQVGRTTRGKIPGQAVICGGSVAGLLAAAVCSDHFESVLVVEAEASTNEGRGVELPDHTERRFNELGVPVAVSPRTRIMQYYAFHGFHPISYTALRYMFPNLQAEMDYLRLRPTVMQRRIAGLMDPYQRAFEEDDIKNGAPLTLPLSREAYEVLVRRCVKNSRPNIKFVTGTVTGVTAYTAHSGKGLHRVLFRTDVFGETEEIAKLVVDASGIAQVGYHKWLRSAGFALPAHLRHEYKPNIQVSSVIFTIPPHLHKHWPVPWGLRPGQIIFQPPDVKAGETRGFAVAVLERNQVIVGIGAHNWSARPRSASEFLATYVDLADYRNGRISSWVFDIFKFFEEHEDQCEPFFLEYSHRSFSWVHYHKAEPGSLPNNFIAVGDALMRLNPSGGQGCTKAMYDAVTLDACLRSVPHGSGTDSLPKDFSHKFFQKQAPRIEHMWAALKVRDYMDPTCVPVEGESLNETPWRKWFSLQVTNLCKKDNEAYHHFWHVQMLLVPPTDLLMPWFLLRVVKSWLLG